MALEIERRFLIKNDSWKEFITKKTFIEQGYLSKNLDDWTIRLRLMGKDYKIALKKHIENFTNFEFEYSIPRKDGETIMSNLSRIIKKERFFLEDFILPTFISKEITGLKHYSNFSLAKKPFSEWNNDYLTTLRNN